MSFLFVLQNDNDLIDNDNAGQSPAAQAVVLTFSLTYCHLNTVLSFTFFFVHSPFFHQHVCSHVSTFTATDHVRYVISMETGSFNRVSFSPNDEETNPLQRTNHFFLYIIRFTTNQFDVNSRRDTVAYHACNKVYDTYLSNCYIFR